MAEQKYYKANGEEYYPDATYYFIDKDGNKITSKGDNGYIWQAVTEGLPISVNSNGDWYVEPYIERANGKTIAHVPNWFKATKEYDSWKAYYDQIPTNPTKETFKQFVDIMKGYGSQGALRQSLKEEARVYGVTDEKLLDKYLNDIVGLYTEGEKVKDASVSLFGADASSITDIAREAKSWSKEDLSKYMTKMTYVLNNKNGKSWTGSYDDQANVLSALEFLKILNYVDDNPSKFGENNEFQGLLEASAWQKIYSHIEAANTGLLNSITAIPARIVYGLGNLIKTGKFDADIAKNTNDYSTDPAAGASLEGREGFISSGAFLGNVENIVITVAVSMELGWALEGAKVAAAGAGGFLSTMGSFAQTIPGAAITDMILHDAPIDLLNFFTNASNYDWDWGKAWENPDEQQNFFQVPILGNFGPKVNAGLKNDLLGDASVDVIFAVITWASGAIPAKLDQWTNGATTRFADWVAVKNLEVQEKLTNLPVFGKVWKKFINHFMGAENANFIREARKASIAEGSMDWYKVAQNVLTLKNHGGSEAVEALYEQLVKKMGIADDIKQFQKEANKYGGVGEVRMDLKDTKGGELLKISQVVPDMLPKQVKQGLLDIERLYELRGQKINDTELLFDAARDKEIARLEEAVEKLPQAIKDFADKISTLNKEVEKIGGILGISNEDWIDAMELDPQFEKYMTRQALAPGYGLNGSTGGEGNPSIWTKSRTGYYSDKYLDPVISLNMKVAALGRAYAWNQQAKTVAAMQISQGKLIAGARGVKLADQMEKVKAEIKKVELTRADFDYDGITTKISSNVNSVVSSVRSITDILNEPGKVAVKSIYSPASTPEIDNFVNDFENGAISFGDGVKAAANISDSEAAAVVRNTYKFNGVGQNSSDNALPFEVPGGLNGKVKNAGVTDRGVAYSYEVEDGVITKMTRIEDAVGMAESIKLLGGGLYNISPKDVATMGISNAQGINRTILYYKNDFPTLPIGPTYKVASGSGNAYGWIPNEVSDEYGYTFKNGQIVPKQTPVFMGYAFYRKGNEVGLQKSLERDVAARFHPRNSAATENVPIHETMHNTMLRLAVLNANKKIKDGLITISKEPTSVEIASIIHREWNEVHERVAKGALDKLGIKYNGNNWKQIWKENADRISRYASSEKYPGAYKWESVAESSVDYWANRGAATDFSLAMMEQVKIESQKFGMAASPAVVLRKNGIKAPEGLLEGTSYKFPSKAKTDAQKAKWLNQWRQDNPFLKGKKIFTEDDYIKANVWDTYFRKEIEAYNPKTKSMAPEVLIQKNGDFLEWMNNNAAKALVEKVKAASVDGFDTTLATIALSKNATDVADATKEFIIRQVDIAAEDLAKKMPGGVNAENLNRARLTLWQDNSVKSDMKNLAGSLTPELKGVTVDKYVDNLFDTQAKGLASYEALSVDFKNLNDQYKELTNALYKENQYAKKVGAKADKALSDYRGEVTHVIKYRQAGEDVYVVVSDPVVASILQRPNDYKSTSVKVEAIAELSNFVSRMYRLGTTGLNPIALVRNVLRDPIQATVTAGYNPFNMFLSPEVFFKTLRQYGLDDNTIQQVSSKLQRWASAGGMTQEIRRMGGETPGTVGYRNNVEKVSKAVNNKIADSKFVKALETPLETWEGMFRNQVAQQSFVKTYRRTKDLNKAMSSAMFDASNATTNFSHSVGLFKRATSTVPYLSSAINGTASFWRLFNIDPIGMTLRITAGFMVPAMAITAWNLSSEERRKAYMGLPEWYRQSHLVLCDVDGNIFSFSIPDEIQHYYGTVRKLVEYTNEATPYGIPTILAQGVFGFLPVETDGYFDEDGSINIGRGTGQLLSGLIPQVATAAYELWAQEKLYTGQDISDYSTFNKVLNALTNVFGSMTANIANDIGFLAGVPEKNIMGRSTMDTLARDLFGMGFNQARDQFMKLVGQPEEYDLNTQKIKKATGLFKENEDIKEKIAAIDAKIASSAPEEKAELEKEKQELVDNFGKKVKNILDKYMQLYTTTGGLENWQKFRVVKLLMLGESYSSDSSDSYRQGNAGTSYLDERSLAMQRYVDLGLPAGPTVESLIEDKKGNTENSIELQAAINRYYGAPKQATQDYKNALEETGLKDIRNEFYDAIDKIYDYAEANNVNPDYDLIEKIQARYLQAVDAVLIPIINEYGVDILNNNDFIDAVRRQVNGMIPSDDWRQSTKNAKRFLSTKEFPTATVDVKKWLKNRYTSGMKNRNLESDQEVKDRLNAIKADIDAGRTGEARGKIEDLRKGINRANYYISSVDYQTLSKYYNMVK